MNDIETPIDWINLILTLYKIKVINIIKEGANAGNIEELITELEVKAIFKKVLNTETLSIDNRIIIL